MPAKKISPTDSELQILTVMWENGPSTVREVYAEIGAKRGVGYTTVLKLMQIMLEKGWLLRDEASRSHVYRPAIPQEKVQRSLAKTLIDTAFGGSAKNLVVEALGAKRPTADELAELRDLIEQMERK